MELAKWKEGLEAWTKVYEQAQIDLEQSELYIQALKQKISDMEKE